MITAWPVIFVRHGQTDWNAAGRFQGQHDIPLNDTGRAQASGNGRLIRAELGNRLSDFHFVSSPLGRTRETMELLRAAMDLPPQNYATDPALIELCFGDWEGQTYDELKLHYPELIALRSKDKWNFLPPGENAESYEILSWRIAGWLKSVSAPTICVTHGGVIRTILKLSGYASTQDAASTDIRQDRVLKYDNGSLTWSGIGSD